MKKTVIILAFIFTCSSSFAQETEVTAEEAAPASKLAIGVDVVSANLWRGIKLTSNKMAFQAYIEYAFTDKFTFGVWGTTNFTHDEKSYDEFDWYAAYQVSPVISLMVSDYYYDIPGYSSSYFNYDNTSNQAIDLSLLLDFSEKGVPVDFQWNTIIAGNDFDDNDERNYSSYSEIGYSHSIESAGIDLRMFAGAVIGKSNYYVTDEFVFTNVGLNVAKEIVFSDNFSLPVFVRYTYNDNGNPNRNWDDTVNSFISGGMSFTIK